MMDRKMAVFSALGFEIIGIIAFAAWLGGILDEKYKLGGLGLVGTIVIGFVGWFIHVILVARILEKRDASGKADD